MIQIEEPGLLRALGADLAAVLERSPQPGPSLTVGDQHHPLPLRFGRKLSG